MECPEIREWWSFDMYVAFLFFCLAPAMLAAIKALLPKGALDMNYHSWGIL